MIDFKASFDKIAEIMAEKAADKDTPFAEITDAFKAMTAYYALLLKHKAKSGDDDSDDGFDFANGIGGEHESGVPGRRSS